MRVIAGRLRGRRLRAPTGDRTRPTADRVRQALFDVLGSVEGAKVLDLYAGSGALGIEALSRGAAHATFVESARPARATIRHNIDSLGLADETVVVGERVARAQRRLKALGPFDLVLCDPPWSILDEAVRDLDALAAARVLAPGARVVLEHPARSPGPPPGPRLEPRDVRSWGDTGVSLFLANAEIRSDSGTEPEEKPTV